MAEGVVAPAGEWARKIVFRATKDPLQYTRGLLSLSTWFWVWTFLGLGGRIAWLTQRKAKQYDDVQSPDVPHPLVGIALRIVRHYFPDLCLNTSHTCSCGHTCASSSSPDSETSEPSDARLLAGRDRQLKRLQRRVKTMEKKHMLAKDIASARKKEHEMEKEARILVDKLYEEKLKKLENEVNEREEQILRLENEISRSTPSPSPDSESSDSSPEYHITYNANQYDNLFCAGVDGITRCGASVEPVESDEDVDQVDEPSFHDRASRQICQFLVSNATVPTIIFGVEDLAAKSDASASQCLTAVIFGIVSYICTANLTKNSATLEKVVDKYAKLVAQFMQSEEEEDQRLVLQNLETACGTTHLKTRAHAPLLKLFYKHDILDPPAIIFWWRAASLRSSRSDSGTELDENDDRCVEGEERLAELVSGARAFTA
ncbi:hypothetical protein HK097_010199, partial [Rhizophlyctis rosea]